MPWMEHLKEESPKIFRDLVDSLVENMPLNVDYVMRDLYIRTAFLKYDFTKRQRSILTFIFGCSYNLGKPKAIFPRMKDFEICGIQVSKAPQELQKLVDMNIITWDKETHEFGIADPSGWEAPINQGFNSSRGRELFILNLKHAGINVEEIMEKSLVKGGIF